MKKILELFDSEPLKNVALHLFFPQAQIIYVGSPGVMTKQRKRAVSRFLEARAYEWTPKFISVENYDIPGIISAVEPVLAGGDDCILDVTGGSETALIAMGILSERYRIPLTQVNLRSCALLPLFGTSFDIPPLHPMSLSQFTLLHGGCIIESADEELAITETLRNDIRVLWQLCREDKGFLNHVAARLNTLADSTNELYVDTCGSELPTASTRTLLRNLTHAGFLNMLSCDSERVCFTYRSKTVKTLLTKAGTTLETITRIAAEDSGVFREVRQGVILDWDGVSDPKDPIETRNEVDVMLLRDVTPIFISCKNGAVKKEALYELEVVARRFGGGFVKKALVCSCLSGTSTSREALRCRAKDMGIVLIENVYEMSLPELSETLARL